MVWFSANNHENIISFLLFYRKLTDFKSSMLLNSNNLTWNYQKFGIMWLKVAIFKLLEKISMEFETDQLNYSII